MTTALAGAVAGFIPRDMVFAGGALLGGYAVGCIPVAWLLVRRAERRRRGRGVERLMPSAIPGIPPPPPRAAGWRPGTLDALAVGGFRVALMSVILELLKGAVVGLGARAYDDISWFTAFAIAGCVVGDAFPFGVRRGRRGIAPLVSGLWAALPGAWSAGVVIAIPAIVVLAIGGAAFEAVLAVCVPLAFVLGTHDLVTLAPATIIVVALVARGRLRRGQRQTVGGELGAIGVTAIHAGAAPRPGEPFPPG